MSQNITIDQAGRIVLPKQVRNRLNLGPGTRLLLDVVAHRIELTPQPQDDAERVVTAGKRTVLRPTGKAFDATSATHAEREAQAGRGSRE
jgi:AbrB family looped-hinge helix DNA binding protein